jgi:hypothetical protein
MMNLSTTLLFYLTIGLGAAVAVMAVERRPGAGRRLFLALTAVLFWPLYVPLLLTAPRDAIARPVPAGDAEPDGMAAAIRQVKHELAAAFASLDGWAEHVLDRPKDHLLELEAALELQAAKIREMDSLAKHAQSAGNSFPLDDLATAEQGGPTSGKDLASGEPRSPLDRFQQSQQARLQNLARLAEIRRAAYTDLMATLAWIRELVSMIHLAKFTGAPAARAEELVAQIAAAVAGISAVKLHENSTLWPGPPIENQSR